ncbi:MAG TPA: restriction endonuclease subunit S, partial [Planctomycetaceae bacterium]|nr:restriction endonuclease subunit S [Planctomycetaceae bacterium]
MSFPRYEEYKDSGVEWLGELPSHWEALPNKVAFRQVKAEVGDAWSDTQLLSLTLRGVVNRDIDSGDGKYPADFGNYQIVEPQDLVMCLFDMDETPRTVGLSGSRGMITSAYDVFRCNPDVDPAYVCYFYRHVDSHKGLRPFYTGLRKTVRTPTFLSIKMPIPPLGEQKSIASFLNRETSKIDALVAEQRRLIELLKEKRQAVISHAVTKGLDPNVRMKPSGIEWLGDVPENWQMKRLKHISPFISVGIVVNPSSYISENPDDLPFIYGGDIREGIIDWPNSRRISASDSALQEKTRLQTDDILVVRVGAPGVAAVVPKACEGGNCASVMLVRKGSFNSQWLCYVMNTPVVRFQVEVVEYGAAQKQFNIAHAVDFWAPVSGRSEQDRIASHLDKRIGELNQLQIEADRAITLLQERRTALISAA